MQFRILYTPFTNDVDTYLFDQITKSTYERKLLYLVPTMILYRKRSIAYLQKVIRNQLSLDDLSKYADLNEFQHWCRKFVYENSNDAKLLSHSEREVLIRRAIRNHFPNRREWTFVAREIGELFDYFRVTGRTISELEEISSFNDWKQLLALYKEYQRLLDPFQDYSGQLREMIIKSKFEEYRELILDGPFLFMDPAHELLINRFRELGKPVTMIVPYDRVNGESNPADRVIEKTYEVFLPLEQWERLGQSSNGASSYLEQAPNILFTARPPVFLDASLELHRFSGGEQELNHVIQNVSALTQKGIPLNEVAIVTPHPMKMRPIVREISEHYNLPVNVTERSILGLTEGEFVRMIYQTRIDERRVDQESFFSPTLFLKILSSEWFTGCSNTIGTFSRLQVFFESLFSIEEWQSKLKQLILAWESLQSNEISHHPLRAVKLEVLQLWEGIIGQFVTIQEQLFSIGAATICEHSEQLMKQLSRLSKQNEWQEREELVTFIARFQRITERMTLQNQLPIETSEFAELIGQLFQEVEEEAEVEGFQQDEGDKEKSKPSKVREVLVTGPQNIAYQEYKYLFLTQFTQDHYPERVDTRWPRPPEFEWKLRAMTTSLPVRSEVEFARLLADRERYYFYQTFRSATIQFWVSFSRTEQGIQKAPSLYLHDLAQSFGVGTELEEKENIEDRLIQENIMIDHTLSLTGGQVREEKAPLHMQSLPLKSDYDLEELATFKLCPRKFWYQQLYPERFVYASSFQLSKYIAAVVYEASVLQMMADLKHRRLVEDKEARHRQARLRNEVNIRVAKQINRFETLFPVHEGIWEEARFYAELLLLGLIDNMFEVFVNHQDQAFFGVEILDGPKEHEISVLCRDRTFSVRGKREVVLKNSGMIRSYSIHDLQEFLVLHAGESEFGHWYVELKKEFFYQNAQAKVRNELRGILESIYDGLSEKRAGEHCIYCPFRVDCQERKSDSILTMLAVDEGVTE